MERALHDGRLYGGVAYVEGVRSYEGVVGVIYSSHPRASILTGQPIEQSREQSRCCV